MDMAAQAVAMAGMVRSWCIWMDIALRAKGHARLRFRSIVPTVADCSTSLWNSTNPKDSPRHHRLQTLRNNPFSFNRGPEHWRALPGPNGTIELDAKFDASDVDFKVTFDNPDYVYEDVQPIMALNGT